MKKSQNIEDLLIHSYCSNIGPEDLLDVVLLRELVDDTSSNIRICLAKSLAYCGDQNIAVPLLCRLSQDDDPCVRVEAVDSLSNFICQESFDVLRQAFFDMDILVRAFAAFGIAYVGRIISPNTALNLLERFAEEEQSHHVLVSVHEGLYILGKADSLYSLFNLFDSDDYHVQCAVINALTEITYSDNRSTIKQFANSLNDNHLVASVADSVHRLRAYLSN